MLILEPAADITERGLWVGDGVNDGVIAERKPEFPVKETGFVKRTSDGDRGVFTADTPFPILSATGDCPISESEKTVATSVSNCFSKIFFIWLEIVKLSL